jgi:hypothetical protein
MRTAIRTLVLIAGSAAAVTVGGISAVAFATESPVRPLPVPSETFTRPVEPPATARAAAPKPSTTYTLPVEPPATARAAAPKPSTTYTLPVVPPATS